MGQCFENEQLGMIEEAIKCYRRAAENGDREGDPPTSFGRTERHDHCCLVEC
jgi:hypothetical protein